MSPNPSVDGNIWNEDDYFALDENILIEFSPGKAEVPPMPTTLHQMILSYLNAKLLAIVTNSDLVTVLFRGLRVRLWPGQFREPDLVFMKAENSDRMVVACWEGADLVKEVVSENRTHDLVSNRQEYAQDGIPE